MIDGVGAGTASVRPPLIATVLLVLMPSGLQAVQASAIRIDGIVVSGPDSVARPTTNVELHRITADSGVVVDQTISGADGSFLLSVAREDDPGAVWLAVARHLGVSYFGPAVHPGADPPRPYVIQVFDTTVVASPEDADLVARRVAITPGVDAEGRTAVAELLDVRGPGDRAVVRASPGEPVWETVLPEGASSFAALPGGVPAEALSRRGDTVSVAAALSPMGLRIGFRYLVPGGTLRLPTPQAASEFVILVDERLGRVDVPGFTPASRGREADSGDSAMARFTAVGVARGAAVDIVFEPRGDSGSGPAWVWIGVGALLTAAAAASARRGSGPPVAT